MKKIGLILCLFFILLSSVNSETSKDIMIKYEYTDNTSKHTKEIVDNRVEYELNEDKIKIILSESKDMNVILFEVSTESLEWLKTKVDISKDANVYYLKVLNIKDEKTISNITIEECSGKQKVITIYDENGNKIENPQNDCYIVIEKVDNTETKNNEEININKENLVTTKGEQLNIEPLIIVIICLSIIFILLIILVKIRKDKENE